MDGRLVVEQCNTINLVVQVSQNGPCHGDSCEHSTLYWCALVDGYNRSDDDDTMAIQFSYGRDDDGGGGDFEGLSCEHCTSSTPSRRLVTGGTFAPRSLVSRLHWLAGRSVSMNHDQRRRLRRRGREKEGCSPSSVARFCVRLSKCVRSSGVRLLACLCSTLLRKCYIYTPARCVCVQSLLRPPIHAHTMDPPPFLRPFLSLNTLEMLSNTNLVCVFGQENLHFFTIGKGGGNGGNETEVDNFPGCQLDDGHGLADAAAVGWEQCLRSIESIDVNDAPVLPVCSTQ